MESLREKVEEEVRKYKQIDKDRDKYALSRQQLEGQLMENRLVKDELERLPDESTKVFKQIGSVLVRQDLTEARHNVDKRIEYIEQEIKRVDGTLVDTEGQLLAQRTAVNKAQEQLQAFVMKQQQQLAQK